MFHWSFNSWSAGGKCCVCTYTHICGNPRPYLCRCTAYFKCTAASVQYLSGSVGSLVHVFVWMFVPKKTEDWQGPEGGPEIFDLNTYFHILVLSELAPVTRDKACFPAHLKVIDTFHNKARNQARETANKACLFSNYSAPTLKAQLKVPLEWDGIENTYVNIKVHKVTKNKWLLWIMWPDCPPSLTYRSPEHR